MTSRAPSSYTPLICQFYLVSTSRVGVCAELLAEPASYVAAETWLLWIQAKQAKQGSSGPVHDLTGPLELVQLYERAIQDFVCTFPLAPPKPVERQSSWPGDLHSADLPKSRARLTHLAPTRPTPHLRTAIPLLLAYSNYFIANHYRALGLAPPPPADADEDNAMAGARQVGEPDLVLGAAFGIDQVRAARHTALEIGGAHLSEVSKIF